MAFLSTQRVEASSARSRAASAIADDTPAQARREIHAYALRDFGAFLTDALTLTKKTSHI
jgi:hypothetical protein